MGNEVFKVTEFKSWVTCDLRGLLEVGTEASIALNNNVHIITKVTCIGLNLFPFPYVSQVYRAIALLLESPGYRTAIQTAMYLISLDPASPLKHVVSRLCLYWSQPRTENAFNSQIERARE